MPLTQEFYTKEELAELLKVTTKTIDRLRSKGDLLAHKVGGTVRFHQDDIKEFLLKTKDKKEE